jgi:hypothetical protein
LVYSFYFPDLALEVRALNPRYPSNPPTISARIKSGAERGAIPEKVSESMRPKTAAGLANDVEDVKK